MPFHLKYTPVETAFETTSSDKARREFVEAETWMRAVLGSFYGGMSRTPPQQWKVQPPEPGELETLTEEYDRERAAIEAALYGWGGQQS